jgi:hypothetical protein
MPTLHGGGVLTPLKGRRAWAQEALRQDRHALDAAELARMTGGRLQALLSLAAPMPLQEQRATLLREVPTLIPLRASQAGFE